MVLKLDQAFFERAHGNACEQRRNALKVVLLEAGFLDGRPDDDRRAVSDRIDEIWSVAERNFAFNSPVNLQKYTLIILTQNRWRVVPLHYRYTARMIGTTDRAWRLESGVMAVYQNVLAQHYLTPPIIEFIAKNETKEQR